MTTEWVRSQIRMPPELAEWLRVRAFENRRSRNAELVTRLEAARSAELIRASEEPAVGIASQD